MLRSTRTPKLRSGAHSDDKLEWKQSGNYFPGEELRAMEEAARRELVLEFCPEPLVRAD